MNRGSLPMLLVGVLFDSLPGLWSSCRSSVGVGGQDKVMVGGDVVIGVRLGGLCLWSSDGRLHEVLGAVMTSGIAGASAGVPKMLFCTQQIFISYL